MLMKVVRTLKNKASGIPTDKEKLLIRFLENGFRFRKTVFAVKFMEIMRTLKNKISGIPTDRKELLIRRPGLFWANIELYCICKAGTPNWQHIKAGNSCCN